MVKELGLGIGISVLIIMLIQGLNIIPLLFIAALAFFMWQVINQKGLKGTFRGGSKKDISPISFDDIGGQKTAKQELLEALDFIKNKAKVKHMGIRPIKGILLTGPPGTGKTLLAQAAARYTNSVFKATSGSEFIEMYAGLGAKRIRNLFQEAHTEARKDRKKSAIIFIDEIDILGGKRGQVTSHLEYDQTLNQLLVEMDGLSVADKTQILVMATTNRIDILDSALLRPGRFDRIVQVDLPGSEGRQAIIDIHTANKPLASDVKIEQIATETFGFSGAHLENLCNEAAIIALREKRKKIEQRDFLEAIDKVIMGEKLERRPEKKELKRIAVHESGHALVAEVLNKNSVATINITSRGQALGYVRHNRKNDEYLQTEKHLKEQICVNIAGSLSEEMILSTKSTGAVSDFKNAIELVEKMVTSGMTELGVVDKDNVPADILHREMSKILKECELTVKEIIAENKDIISRISELLLEKEKISGDKLRKLLDY